MDIEEVIEEIEVSKSANLNFGNELFPGLVEITDQDSEDEIIGFIRTGEDGVVFYPKAGQAYSADALAAITREVQRRKKKQELIIKRSLK